MPRVIVSIIIPTRNRPVALRRAIRSALDQTFCDLEVLVVDDASEPPVGPIIDEFHDPRIRYIRREVNGGSSASRNTGIGEAKGRFISFLDDDDRYLREKIEKQLQVYERCSHSVGLVYCGYIFPVDGGKGKLNIVPRKSRWEYLHHKDHIGIAPLLRRQCFRDVGLFDEGLTYFEDVDMWYRISQKYDFSFCPEVLYEVIGCPLPSGSSTKKILAVRLESLGRYYQKHTTDFEFLPKRVQRRILSKYHLERALSFFHFDRTDEARDESFRSLRLYPFSFKSWKLLILGIMDEKGRRTLRTAVQRIRSDPSVSNHSNQESSLI